MGDSRTVTHASAPPAAEAASSSRAVTVATALVIATAAAVHVAMAATTDLTPDEAYYASWAFGWARGDDHPPLVAWLISASTTLVASRAEWAIRLPAVVCSAVASALLSLAAARASIPGRWIVAAVAIAQLDVLVAAGGFLVTPDGPFMVAWTLVLVVTISRESKPIHSIGWLVAAGALGGLAKVSMLVALPVVAIGSSAIGWRAVLVRTTAVAVGLAAVAPWWWPSLVFQLGHVAGAHGPERLAGGVVAELGAGLGAFVGLVGPGVFFFGMIGVIERCAARATRALVAAALVPLGVVLASALTAHLEASWSAPAHPPWILLAVLAMRDRFARPAWRAATVAAIALSALLCAGAHVVAFTGTPWRPDPTARLRGWRAWAAGDAQPADAPDPRFPAYGLDAARRYYRTPR
ncbi:MAG: glycosyltransferase family 39 protein [Deltaproteobacteria bacterium]|nr:glycosyltransferase family 39 protein [Deltaproteobacteria bacterium]